ncbi:MAG: hypothetical protein ABSF62_24220, partial [Bryobacteraceae bacterium]
MSRTVELCLVWTTAAVVVGWQLFVPPVIGLADQGDFVRVLGPLGYAPQPKGPEHKYWYLTRKYVWDPSYRAPRFEQITSELIPAGMTIALHRAFTGQDAIDLTSVGFTHAAIFLLALARLLYVTRDLARRRLVWAAMLLILTDVGYVAYWNSWYTEPASCLWFLFLLAESIALLLADRPSMGMVLRWNIFAILLITAKTQNAPLFIPLCAYGLRLAWRAFDRSTRCAAFAGAAATLAAGIVMYSCALPAPRLTNTYNMIFFAVLPESDDPAGDLKALGLDPGYARFSGTVAWSPGTGVADGSVVAAMQAKVSPLTLVAFYAKRPARLWKRVKAVLLVALSLRPEFCGNFDRSAGRFPGARSHAIALWSSIHERYLSRAGVYLLGAILLAPFAGLLLLFKAGLPPGLRRWTELGICLTTCCSVAFLSAAFGDAWEPVKHQFLFNLLLDACL